MMCGHIKELMAASWTGELDAAGEATLRQHLSGCEECNAEMAHLSAMWERLADMPAPEPSHALNVRWQSTLESLKASHASERRTKSWKFSLAALWPDRPVWQVGAAVTCLLVGLAIGSRLPRGGSEPNEIAKLRDEVASTKEMVALSLLQQQSATERLRGVNYTEKMPTIEPQVISALIQAVNHDANVNVRLAAIDALTKVSGDAGVRRSLTQSIGLQDSPMVQAALIDYVVDARDKQATGSLQQLAGRADLNPLVRQRADRAVRELAEYR